MPSATQSPAAGSRLYLRLAESSFSFARYDGAQAERFTFSYFPFQARTSLTLNLRDACLSDPVVTQQSIAATTVIAVGPVTPVPLAEFQEEDCATFYNYLFPSSTRRRIFYDVLKPANCVLIFALPAQTCHTLEDAFPNVRYVSHQTAILKHFAHKAEAGTRKSLFAYVHEDTLDIAIFEDRHLLTQNTFVVHASTDAAYYILNLARQVAADPERDAIFVAGGTEERHNVITEMKKYTPSVFPINPGAEYNRHPVATRQGVPYDLTALLLDISR